MPALSHRCLTGRAWEEWRPIDGSEGSYEVSSMGRIRSLDRVVVATYSKSNRRVAMRYRGKILRPTEGRDGYASVKTGTVNGHRRTRNVRDVVARAFLGPRLPGMYVCHSNGNPRDNRVVNLRWDTPTGNMADAIRHGTVSHGTGHYLAKLTEDDVRAIREAVGNGVQKNVLAKQYGVDRMNIHAIVVRHTWKHVE